MMNWRKWALSLGLLMGLGKSLLAQPMGTGSMPQQANRMAVVSGKVLDSTSLKPLNLVVVELVKLGEKPLLEGGLTDTTGVFRVSVRSGFGKYVLKLTAVGFPVLEIADTIVLSEQQPLFNCGTIWMNRLEGVAEKMEGAEIRVSGPVIENKIDRLVYNAGQDITAKGGSASDLLAKVPMVEVDMDGNVSIRGSRNLRVLINGRPSGMMAGSVADALRSLPADGIEVSAS